MLPIWAAVLGASHVTPTSNFFDIGGHSLLAAKLVVAISADLDVRCTVLDLFDAPTARELARALRPPSEPPTPSTPPIDESAARPMSRDLALIGMAGRFPGAHDLDSFWSLLELN